jgi:hypothetical protein
MPRTSSCSWGSALPLRASSRPSATASILTLTFTPSSPGEVGPGTVASSHPLRRSAAAERLFRHKVFAFLLREELITHERVELLSSCTMASIRAPPVDDAGAARTPSTSPRPLMPKQLRCTRTSYTTHFGPTSPTNGRPQEEESRTVLDHGEQDGREGGRGWPPSVRSRPLPRVPLGRPRFASPAPFSPTSS